MRSELPAVASRVAMTVPSGRLRYMGMAAACLLGAAVFWPLWRGAGEGRIEAAIAPVCSRWDDLARGSIARLVQNGRRDADLRQAGDAIFRLRRARRNCNAGWTTLACQEYRAISSVAVSRPHDQPECPMAQEVAGAVR